MRNAVACPLPQPCHIRNGFHIMISHHRIPWIIFPDKFIDGGTNRDRIIAITGAQHTRSRVELMHSFAQPVEITLSRLAALHEIPHSSRGDESKVGLRRRNLDAQCERRENESASETVKPAFHR